MRFMVIVKATADSEAGRMPTRDSLVAMQKFNEGVVEAGAMLSGEGLLSSSKGARIVFSSGSAEVVPGPFTNAEDLVSGFWIVRGESLGQVVDLMKRAPLDPGSQLEIRRIAEAADFGDAMTPELQAIAERLAAGSASNAS